MEVIVTPSEGRVGDDMTIRAGSLASLISPLQKALQKPGGLEVVDLKSQRNPAGFGF